MNILRFDAPSGSNRLPAVCGNYHLVTADRIPRLKFDACIHVFTDDLGIRRSNGWKNWLTGNAHEFATTAFLPCEKSE